MGNMAIHILCKTNGWTKIQIIKFGQNKTSSVTELSFCTRTRKNWKTKGYKVMTARANFFQAIFGACLATSILLVPRLSSGQSTDCNIFIPDNFAIWMIKQSKIGQLPLNFGSVQFIELIFPELLRADKQFSNFPPSGSNIAFIEVDSKSDSIFFEGKSVSSEDGISIYDAVTEDWTYSYLVQPFGTIDLIVISSDFDALSDLDRVHVTLRALNPLTTSENLPACQSKELL